MKDYHQLTWRQLPTILAPLPPHITRSFISTPNGKLELLSAQPSQPSTQPRKKAIVFQHGGFGYAAVWIPFLTFFSQQGYPSYAVSLRGHGGSWKPGFFRMVWMTGKASMAEDLGYTLLWVEGFESGKREVMSSEDIVLVGHSAGGGLSQYFLSKQLGEVGGLVILAGFPNFGSFGVYWNWFCLDPWFVPRYYIRDLWHSRSPLSSTTLVHRAFFAPEFSRAEVKKFEVYMPEFESMLWPLGMMFPFVNTKNVLRSIVGWKDGSSRLLVIAGEKDTLMGVPLMRKMAAAYKIACAKIFRALPSFLATSRKDHGCSGVKFAMINKSGHHVQNDLHWEECAREVLRFMEKL